MRACGNGRLCVRSCSWLRVDAFLRRMKCVGGGPDGHDRDRAPRDDKREFNTDYILRQLESMRNGPEQGELHVLLQVQPASSSGAPAAPAATEDVLGIVAATARLSRRIITVEFRAIYVVPALRCSTIAPALVHFAFADVEKQTEQRARAGQPMPWGQSQVAHLIAFVTLPHCMQTSADFWSRVGFQLGEKVDKKEHKQATLGSKEELSRCIPEPRWEYRSN